MKFSLIAALAFLTVAGSACKMNAVNEYRPARIANPTEESRAELRRVIGEMLFGAEVTLDDDALTESSVLVIERNRVRGLDSPPLSGRDLGQPERFQLVTNGARCVLIHGNDQARRELEHTDCVTE